jgi:AcrR family transcriptional regulator
MTGRTAVRTGPSTTAARRPLRRDAEANRERILRAAGELFAARGLDASVEEIAATADVGMGTLYRRFPTKDALIAALVDDVLETMLALAESALDAPDGLGLERYIEAGCRYQAEHPGCLPRLWNASSGAEQLIARVRSVVSRLLSDAKAHRRVRADVTATDVTVLMWSVRGVIETSHCVAPDAWRRHLDILIAGLRPASAPLPHPALTRRQVDLIISGNR